MRTSVRVLLPMALLVTIAMATYSIADAPESASAAGVHPWKVRLDPPGEPGFPFELSGRVLVKSGGPPARGIKLYVYHADASGKYGANGERDPRLAGTLHTNVLGEYQVRSILPGPYGGEPHFHMRIDGPDESVRGLTLGFLRSRGAGSDSGLATLSQMIEMPTEGFNAYVERDDDGVLKARYDIVLAKLPIMYKARLSTR